MTDSVSLYSTSRAGTVVTSVGFTAQCTALFTRLGCVGGRAKNNSDFCDCRHFLHVRCSMYNAMMYDV